jgi:hypothetical protein
MLRVVLLAALLVVGGCVASVAVPTASARPTCSPFAHLDDPDALVACVEQDVPCLPRPCG